jgi:transcriptional regulator with XRE-family HTH domain
LGERSVTIASSVIGKDSLIEFAIALRALVKSKGLTYKDIHDRLGIPVSTLGNWLTSKSLIREAALQSIVELCGGNVHDWARQWNTVKSAAKALPAPPEQARRDLVELISRALGVRDELPIGTEVELTVILRLP